MGWLNDLYQTYENNLDQVGKVELRKNGSEYTLLPIGHTTQNAQVEVVVDLEGNFYSAKVIDKENSTTVVPCSEESFSRTSKPVPHPLHDKLMYTAGDFDKFGGKVSAKDLPHQLYINNLKEWADSDYSHNYIKAIYRYLKQGRLIQDLVQYSVLHLDEYGKLIYKWDKNTADKYGDKPEIFKVLNETQDKVFVRFDVHQPMKLTARVWNDLDIYNSYINFYKTKLSSNDICYVSGNLIPKASKHSSGIHPNAANAKLISANDSSGYTYRGRFEKGEDVANISYDVSQKAHNALKWLINKQGKQIDGRVFLVWGDDQPTVPFPQDDIVSLFEEIGFEYNKGVQVEENQNKTHEIFANEVNKALAGYKSNLQYQAKVNVIILEAFSKGRLSVLYYRNLTQEEYLKRLEYWHHTCTWLHKYKKGKNFDGAPSSRDIAEAAYGRNANKKVIKDTVERLLPCVIDGQRIPIDLYRNLYHRASNPISMDQWEWRKVLSITCAITKKHLDQKGEYNVSLDPNNTNRDYLFGRLLAIADVLERRALSSEDDRASNALRYMNTFAQHPARTWGIIQANLQPYQARLGSNGVYYSRLIDEVASQIDVSDFNNKKLSGLYLLGFYSQRHELYKSKEERQKSNKND
ncbi:type I-C CRISPR-associated protein Cas8c/Csd1 [Alkalibacillus silvisoli]|uniref:Type I-C CRISPR-associated protein Cas8c/Csd1 n=1 Tax=Alkalibacillus silvisoli TaxID=392823 RepID=A0ABN0ZM70_9BACI